jgi:antitoxin component YwqK of YwqJK toxin-antitoxin module
MRWLYKIILINCVSCTVCLGQIKAYYDSIYLDSCFLTSKDGKIEEVVCFNKFKKLTRSGYLRNNKKQGHWKFFDNDLIVYEGDYLHDRKKGYWREYYISGHELYVGKYKNDKANGIWKIYSSNNKKFYEIPKLDKKYLIKVIKYKEGKLNGRYVEFYSNGQVKTLGNYILNKKIGLWKYYNSDGSLSNQELLK